MRWSWVSLLLVAIAGCATVTPSEATRLMEDPASPDNRREGIADLATQFDFARVPPYTLRYQAIAKSDADYTVRAMAIRALNVSRDRSAVPIYIAAMDDDHVAVRLEAAKALANVPSTEAVRPLLLAARGVHEVVVDGRSMQTPEDRDVRIAAADALRRYPTELDVKRTLIGLLNEGEFGLAWQAHQSLVTLTGQDLRYDEAAWLQYLVKAGT